MTTKDPLSPVYEALTEVRRFIDSTTMRALEAEDTITALRQENGTLRMDLAETRGRLDGLRMASGIQRSDEDRALLAAYRKRLRMLAPDLCAGLSDDGLDAVTVRAADVAEGPQQHSVMFAECKAKCPKCGCLCSAHRSGGECSRCGDYCPMTANREHVQDNPHPKGKVA